MSKVIRTARWLGGPWDGEPITLGDAVWSVPAIDPQGDVADPSDLSEQAPAPVVHVCPVRMMSDRRLVVVWQD